MTILQSIFPMWLNNVFSLLATEAYSNSFITIHYGWALVHFLLAITLIVVLLKYDVKKPILTAIALIFVFEVFEFLISYGIPIILTEIWQDTLGDILIGLAGIYFGFSLFESK